MDWTACRGRSAHGEDDARMTDSEKSNLARFAALSDGIFAVIFTIMVLDLRPPAGHDLHALLEL